MTVRTTYLATTPDPVLVHHHAPAATDPARVAVVLVPPFGWDEVASYRVRRRWARDLAAAGHHVLRLDLPGTGDSAGGPDGPDRLGAWTTATSQAAAWLRVQAGGARVAAIGLSTGGLVAMLAAAEGAPIDDLTLWNVPGRGRHIVRELQAFAALKASEWGDVPPEHGPLPDGWLDVSGYVLSAETAAALAAVRLDALRLPEPAGRRVLLLGRDGTDPDPRLRAALEQAGVAVSVAASRGWGAMTQGPQEAEAPSAVMSAVASWLAAAPAGARAPAGVAPPTATSALVLDGVVERPWIAERSFGRQFGVLTRPAEDGPAPLGLLLLNGGAVRHTGPNRMWVEAARRTAARGVPVLRVDNEGLGDSDGDERPYAEDASLYASALAEQATAACADLAADGVAERWVLAGLCSGAYWAFHAALGDAERIAALVLLNPFTLWWDDHLTSERDAAAVREAGLGTAVRRLAAGEIGVRRAARAAWHALRTPVEARARRRRSRAHAERIAAALDALRDRSLPVTLLLGQGEPMARWLASASFLDRLAEWPNLTLRRLPARDHTFRAPWLQQAVHDVLDDAVAGARDRLPAEPVGAARPTRDQ